MTTMLAPDHLGIPPPLEFELTDGDVVVGWVKDDVIAFRGFADETEAAHAAWLAHRTLRRHLARKTGTRPPPVDTEPLALRRRDGRDEILASGIPISTLRRPWSRPDDDSFGFEIRVPGPGGELRMRAKSYLIYRTLRKSGIRWSLWRRGPVLSASRSATHVHTGGNHVARHPLR